MNRGVSKANWKKLRLTETDVCRIIRGLMTGKKTFTGRKCLTSSQRARSQRTGGPL